VTGINVERSGRKPFERDDRQPEWAGEGRLMVRGGGAVSELSMETPDEDAAEQAREVPEDEDEELAEVPFEADEADAAEQIRDAGYDDEDYR